MKLKVRPATTDEHAFAWATFGPYISTYIYKQHKFTKPEASWLADEKLNFQQSWREGERFIIELDGTAIGWLSMSKLNNKLTVHNIFLDDAWQTKGVIERIFEATVPTWKSEKKVVEVPVLMRDPNSIKIEEMLGTFGFVSAGDDGLVKYMTANWSK